MAAIKHKAQRVGVFIDTQNLYHSAKNLFRARVNFGAVLKEALAGRVLVHAAAYVVTTESGEEKAFFDALTKLGIETKTKDLQVFYGGAKKADWDVGIAVDAIKFAEKLDVIVFATGDGDFIPCVEYLQSKGVQVEVIAFGKSASGKLREAADDFIDMGEAPKTYLLSSSRSAYLPAFIAGSPAPQPPELPEDEGEEGGDSEPTVVGADDEGK